jgi:hypothetical protein
LGLRRVTLLQAHSRQLGAHEPFSFSRRKTSTTPKKERPSRGHLENLLKYEKTLKNLHLKEARLHRRFDKDLAELRELQQTGAREEMLAANAASAAGALDPKVASNLQMLKDMLELDGFKLPNGSKTQKSSEILSV